ncbi:MAG: GGDEF domain-containing protein [Acholeplasmatales bacterium]|nr:MAG: GGDEF domain-containing protein [Acholeplasmatales bacterium]
MVYECIKTNKRSVPMNDSNPYRGKKLWYRIALYLALILVAYVLLTALLQVIIGNYYRQETMEKAELIGRSVALHWRQDTALEADGYQLVETMLEDIARSLLSDPDTVSDASLRTGAAQHALEDWSYADSQSGEILYAYKPEQVGEILKGDTTLTDFLQEYDGAQTLIASFNYDKASRILTVRAHVMRTEDRVLTLIKALDWPAGALRTDWETLFMSWLETPQILTIQFDDKERVLVCDYEVGCNEIDRTLWSLRTTAESMQARGTFTESFLDTKQFRVLYRLEVEAETVGFVYVSFTRAIMNPALQLLYVTVGLVMTALMGLVMAVVIYGSKLRAQAYERSLSDPVTGAYNRTAWTLHTERERRTSIMRMSLHGFDNLVALYGEEFREAVMKTLVERLWTRFPTVRLYRLETDHLLFTLRTDNPSTLIRLAEQIAGVVYGSIPYGAMKLHLTGKFGILMAGDRPDTPSRTLRALLMALNAAEHDPRRLVRLYDRTLQLAVERESLIYKTLHQTLKLGQGEAIRMVYQAQFDTDNPETIVGLEVLSRLNVEGLGWVGPGEFVPLAERRGLIGVLGRHVIEETCRTYQQLKHRYKHVPTLSINASVLELTQAEYTEHLVTTLAAHGMPAEALYVELTETAFAQNRTALMQTLKGLKKHGVRIALDDFGAGYSSLAYLTLLNIDRIKIDRQFIVSMETEALATQVIKSVVDIARSINAEVIAEGIETEEQLEQVKAIGVRTVQGYLFQKPIDQVTLIRKLDKQNSVKQP